MFSCWFSACVYLYVYKYVFCVLLFQLTEQHPRAGNHKRCLCVCMSCFRSVDIACMCMRAILFSHQVFSPVWRLIREPTYAKQKKIEWNAWIQSLLSPSDAPSEFHTVFSLYQSALCASKSFVCPFLLNSSVIPHPWLHHQFSVLWLPNHILRTDLE